MFVYFFGDKQAESGMMTNGTSDWVTHEVAPDVELRIARDMPALDAALDDEVSRLWDAAQVRMGGHLFNGRVFSADEITPGLITGHWTEFRRIVAQIDQPGMHARLGVRPLATGGLILGPDGVVFGRRPVGAVYQGGQWQLPPAGSIDPGAERAGGRVDAMHQVLTELEEELGLTAEAVGEARFLCIVEHPGSHVLDFGIFLRTGLLAAEIHAAHAQGGNGEYEPLEIVPVEGLAAFLDRVDGTLTEQARFFLARTGLLPD
jgi:hypothetical protein